METNSYLGIDVGGTKMKYARVYFDGTLEQTHKLDTPDNLTDFLAQIDVIYRSFEDGSFESVALSLPGKVDSEKGVVYFGGSLPYLHNFDFKKHFKETYGKNCTIINDGKAAALCELWLGNLQGVKNGLVITLGTGVGGGIIIDGKLHQGQTFQAGELSFMTKDPFDTQKTNLVGAYLSAVEFIAKCGELLDLQKPYDGELVFDEIKKGNHPLVNSLFHDYVKELLKLIINLQAVLNMEKVLIGGGISEQPLLLDELTSEYAKLRQLSPIYDKVFEPLVIDSCAFKNNSNILGAVYASMHIDQF